MFRKVLLAVLLAVAAAAPARAEWRQASSDHFVIYSEDSARQVQEFAAKLERYDRAMRRMWRIPDEKPGPANRLTIFVVPDPEAVQKLAGRKDGWLSGFYIGRATGSIAVTPRSAGDSAKYGMDPQTVLLHEYAHHFMRQNYPAAFPAWFVEGFAEFNSTARFEKDGSVGLGTPAHHRAHGLLTGKPLSIEQLMTSSDRDLKNEEREAIYGRGWLLTHYATFNPARYAQLQAYLTDINKGKSNLEAARAAFGDLKALDKELDKYLMRPRMTYLKLAASSLPTGRIEVRDLTPGEAAVMNVRIRSKVGVSPAEAKALIPLVRKAAAPYPNEPFAQATLAEAEFDAGNLAEAEAAADRALAADPKHVEALIYKGRVRIALAASSKSADSAPWREARKWFTATNRVDPEDPEPLLLFYRSFLEEGVKPTANAAAGLVYALALAPQDQGLRWMVARQHLNDGKVAEARTVLAPLAFDPHGGPRAKAVADLLEKLGTVGAKAAIRDIESLGEEPDEAR